ncbi:protein of unknown function [Peptoniphilus asaccharolyticus DSM 20463]|uniref:Uncharacterized protein n=1 Tax=Peptoniphilus asaccharolyticus DSM 20463 TaxID=573058 RepID=A0A1W1V3G5_PEPAS|nr:DUF3787 domain-containing protein [Peptoniphilus asaccharolyticus]MBL7576146.1 DUF3787 domain-containing protein [Peptoniphilus asaccharolyticus]CRH93059.1 Uncharacterised protein [Chlamydia trachomatis]SMB87594.1 protein of unknown function [Peptoniphilus asaccharolyticus DSM 20463]
MSENKFEEMSTLSEQRKKEVLADLEQSKAIHNENRPATDVYAKSKHKDGETGVETPTEASVEEAKRWVDEENQR